MGIAVIYRRVSTEEQANSGLGLEAQLEACKKACSLRGLDVAAVYTDAGVSGTVDPEDRKGLSDALAALRELQGAVLVVSALSRLTRRQSALWRLLDENGPHQLRLLSATEPFDTSTPIGRAMVGMLGVWAQLEADMISERTKSALAARRARGLRMGPEPVWSARPDVAELVGQLGERLTQDAIVAELNARGIPGPRGRWHRSAVRRILASLPKGKADAEGDTDSRSEPVVEQLTSPDQQVAAGLADREDL